MAAPPYSPLFLCSSRFQACQNRKIWPRGVYTQGADGTLTIDIDGNTGTADKLIVTGTLTLGGTLDVSLLSGDEPTIGDEFDIMDWGALSGTFQQINLPALTMPAAFWDTSELYTTGVLSVGVPEPSTFALLSLCGVGLIGLARRRRRG